MEQSEARLMVVLGIINQLMSTRYSKLFKNQSLNQSQFSVLNHFTHNPEKSWLISDLANVMEMNQPGITKVVAVLVQKSLLESTADTEDKRKRHLKITSQGTRVCKEMIQSLLPDVSRTLADWSDNDLDRFLGDLSNLMKWLDKNRLP